ncbi:MAG: hypothetical protein ACI39F_05270 [Acutalibacteraceae bacterium]
MKFCEKCGKELNDQAVVCPGCGCAVQKKESASSVIPKKAKNARIFGILAVLLLYPLGIPAVILAQQSKKETDGVMCGPAKAGFICGIIALVIWGIAMINLL